MEKRVTNVVFGIFILLVSFGLFVSASSEYIFPQDNTYFFNDEIFVNVSTNLTGDTFQFSNLNNSVVAYYSFDYYNSTGIFDNSSHGNHGVFSGGLSTSDLVSGVFGNALAFDGLNDSVDIFPEGYHLVYDSAAVSLWFKTNTLTPSYQTFLGGATDNRDMIGLSTTYFRAEGDTNGNFWSYQTSVSADQWYHLVLSANSTGVYTYFNGSLVDFDTSATTNLTVSLIGGRYGYQSFNGTLDEIIIFNRSVSPQEVSALYSSPSAGYNIEVSDDVYSLNSYVSNGSDFDSLGEIEVVNGGPANITISFPLDWTLFQRNSSNLGLLNLAGNYSSLLFPLEFSFNGSSWINLSSASEGIFNQNYSLSPSRVNLTIRSTNYSYLYNSSLNVGVGDLFLVTGQSNSYGSNWNLTPINTTVPFDASILYRHENTTPADPLPEFLGSDDLWAHAAYDYIRQTNIPAFFIVASKGGSRITHWQNDSAILYNSNWDGYNLYNYSQKLLENVTRDNFIRSIIWMQGEGDYSLLTYDEYTSYLNLTKNNFTSDFDFYNSSENNFIVGQINYNYGNDMSNIQKAQQNAWKNFLNVGIGVISHDIYIGDDVHYMDGIPYARYTYSKRWMYALLGELLSDYTRGGPIPTNVYKINSTTLDIVYDRYIYSDNYIGNDTDSTPKGIRIYNSTTSLNDSNVLDVNVSNMRINRITVTFDQEILSNLTDLNFTMCSNHTCNNQVTIRGSNTVPTEIIFEGDFSFETPTSQYLVDRDAEGVCSSGSNLTYCVASSECSSAGGYWYSDSCNSAAQTSTTTTTSSSGSSIPTSTLENGYKRIFNSGQSASLNIGSATYVAKVTSVSTESVSVSVDGSSVDVKVGTSEKVDLDSDGVYDLEITVNSVDSSGNANLEFKAISEAVPSEVQEEVSEEVITEEEKPLAEKTSSWYLKILSAVALVIVLGIVFEKLFRKKKKSKKKKAKK